jgi:SAM-dependent methyltransferase
MQPTEAYRTDLAYIHDAGFGDFAKKSAPGLLRILRENGINSGLVIDLGCGSGIWARELSDSGFGILGVDISPAMIAIARERVPRGEFITASLLRVTLPRCVAVTSLGECLNYLFDPSNRMVAIRRLFHRVYKALQPGGLFVFDIAEPGREDGPRQNHRQGPGWAVLVDVDLDARTNRLTRCITTFRKDGALYRRDEEIHSQQLYKRGDIAKELRSAGFRVRTIDAYGAQQMIRGCVGFIARKPTGSR